jgi:chromosome segregation ATPase
MTETHDDDSNEQQSVVVTHHQHLVDLSRLTSHPDSPLSRGAARAAVDDAVDELTAAGDRLVRATAQSEQSLVAEELARRRAEREARERALQEREVALLAAVEEEERDWVAQQHKLDAELARQREAQRAELQSTRARLAAADDVEAYRKLLMLACFILAALFLVFHHTAATAESASPVAL